MSWMRADVLPAIAGASRMTRLVERQITVRFATMALAALLIFSFCARSSSQPPAVPEGPSGFYVLELSFANQDRPEIWDAAKTKQVLTGFWLLKRSWDDAPAQFNSEDRNLAARLKARSVGTNVGTIHYVIKWEKIAHIELTFQDTGSTNLREVQPLGLCSECDEISLGSLPPLGTFFRWDGPSPNLRQAMLGYIDHDTEPMASKIGKLDRSGSFVLRVTDASNSIFYLPIARASWHVNHYDDGRAIPFRSEDILEVRPVLQ